MLCHLVIVTLTLFGDKMEIKHLLLIQAVAESGTLSAAANRLYLSQPALSKQLRSVENELGVLVFYRTGKKMILTPVGEQLVHGAGKIINEFSSLISDVRANATGESGLLRIVTSYFTCYHWLPGLLRKFRNKYPRVEVQINLSAMSDPAGALKDRRLDLGIVGRHVPEPEFDCKPLFNDENVIIVNRNHRWSKRKYVNYGELTAENLIVFDQDLTKSDIFIDHLTPAGIRPEDVSRMPMTETIIDMVRSNLGIALLTRWVVKPYLRSRDLVVLRMTKRGLTDPWYSLVLKDPYCPPYVREFINLLGSAND